MVLLKPEVVRSNQMSHYPDWSVKEGLQVWLVRRKIAVLQY